MSANPTSDTFEAFVSMVGPRLRRALVARYGLDIGSDVYADALERAWTEWPTVTAMANPAGYLFRCAQSASRRYRRWARRIALPMEEHADGTPMLGGDDIFRALERLTADQRTAVMLVHAYGWSYQEVADLLGVPITSVNNYLSRGMRRLRRILGDPDE